MQFIV